MRKATKQVYYCEHCKKHGLRKHSMAYHEDICSKNPSNIHPCYDCIHFSIEEGANEVYLESGGEIITNDVPYKEYVCNIKKISMHSRRTEAKGLLEKYPKTFEGTQLMPLKYCNEQKKRSEMDYAKLTDLADF